MRAHKHVLLPQEDAAGFAALEAALLDELAPEGALQTVLARRIVMTAWRLARADRIEAEALEARSYEGANAGLALLGRRNGAPTPFRRPRDGNGTRAFETLMRYRGAAMAELTRALRTLKALQADQAQEHAPGADVLEMPPRQPRVPARRASRRATPNEPERRPLHEYVIPDQPGHTLHEPASRWLPNEPENARDDRLRADAATIATRPTARGATTGAQAGPEPSLASLLSALELIGGGGARRPNEPEKRRAHDDLI